MNTRTLGPFQVSSIGLGCMNLSHAYGVPPSAEQGERVLLADGEPVGMDTLWFPRRLGETLKGELKGRFVMPMLERFGHEVDHIDYRFEAATATGSQAALLKVTTGFPLLVIHFTPISPEGLPILAGRTTTRADRFVYEFCGKPKAHRAAPPRRRRR